MFRNKQLAALLLAFHLLITAIPTSGISATVFLQWDPSTEADAAGYKVYYQAGSSAVPFEGSGATEGSAPIDVGNTTMATVSGLAPESSFYFAVTAYDNYGIESVYSNVIFLPAVTDTLPPTVTFIMPVQNGVVSGNVPLQANASDDVAVTRVEVYDGQDLIFAANDNSCSFDWNSVLAQNGSHTMSTKAYDAAGNTGISQLDVVVDNPNTTAPVITQLSPSDGSRIAGNTEIISASATDDVSVSTMELYIDKVLKFSTSDDAFTWTWNIRSYSKGTHLVEVKAYDEANNAASKEVGVIKP